MEEGGDWESLFPQVCGSSWRFHTVRFFIYLHCHFTYTTYNTTFLPHYLPFTCLTWISLPACLSSFSFLCHCRGFLPDLGCLPAACHVPATRSCLPATWVGWVAHLGSGCHCHSSPAPALPACTAIPAGPLSHTRVTCHCCCHHTATILCFLPFLLVDNLLKNDNEAFYQ